MLKTHKNLIPENGKSIVLAISIGVFSMMAIIAIFFSFWDSSESSHDAIAINLAGRQRMLTQRIEKNLLTLSYLKQNNADTSLILHDLSFSYLLFDQTLTALSKGRLLDQDGKTFSVASTQTKNASAIIKQANSIWRPMQAALLPIISTSDRLSDDALEQAIFILMKDNQQLLLLMNSLTSEIENAAHKKSKRLKTTQALSIALILIDFVFLALYFRRQYTTLLESKLLATRIMENAGTAIMVINAGGYIEQCNHAAAHMFGLSTSQLAGIKINTLLDEPYFMQIGRHANGARFALDIDLNEIYASGHKIFIASLHDLTEQKFREDQLNYLAYHDPLTGLPNRLLFLDRLAQTLARAHRELELVAILYIDLDRFKQVNDTLGHATGDLLLQEVATRLTNCLREGDTIARLGGDEFAMVIDANDANNCAAIAQKILIALSQAFILNGHTIQISGSIGASLYPNDGNEIDTLLHDADIAMYRAKAKGGNHCVKYKDIAPADDSVST